MLNPEWLIGGLHRALDPTMSKSTMLKWLAGLATAAGVAAIAVLTWMPGAPTEETPTPSAAMPSAREGLPPAVEPSWRGNGPLSLAELRWCMTEEVRLEEIEPLLATRPAVDQYNLLAANLNRRCGRRNSSDEHRERVTTSIADSRESIVAGAIEDIERLNATVTVSTSRIEELLSRLGYDPGIVDGVYEAKTKEAIESFQRHRGLPVDGLFSPELLDQLVGAWARIIIRSERCRIRDLFDASEQQNAETRC